MVLSVVKGRCAAAVLTLTVAVGAAAQTAQDAAWVKQRAAQWQPTEREKRWEGIGWAGSIREAERLGKEHNRPIFLFTLDGKMNVGRC